MKLESLIISAALVVAVCCVGGCERAESQPGQSDSPEIQAAPPELQTGPMTAAELRAKLGANANSKFQKVGGEIVEAYLLDSGVKDLSALAGLSLRALDLGRCDVDDISVLKGMPLKNVILEDTQVADISALEGMQLEVVYLQNTKVSDISVLAGMPIRQLNLMGTRVTNLDAIQGMPLEILWVPDTPLSDISGVADNSMISLDIRGTQVTDLTPLAGMQNLQRLNIVDCDIKDVTPLSKLNLQRLLLTPQNVEKGMDALRKMPSLKQLGIDGINVQSALPAAQFWEVYDGGGFRPKDEDTETPSDSEDAEDAATTEPAQTPDKDTPENDDSSNEEDTAKEDASPSLEDE